jgi:hypothetical protein
MKKKLFLAGVVILILGAVTATRKWEQKKEEAKNAQEIEQATEHIEQMDIGMELRYYFQDLEEDEKDTYQLIADGIRLKKQSVKVPLSDAEQVNRIYQEVLMDFPEFFWCSGSVKTTAYSGKNGYSEVAPGYLYEEDEAEKRQEEVDQITEQIVDQISADASDYDKVKFIYEYIIDNTDYNVNAKDNQNIYSVLAGGESVCAGYAKTMQYLMNRIGMFCTYVIGTTDTGEDHAWNLVQCDGKYYYVDATWGDPVFAQKEEGVDINNITYDYLCCTDEVLFQTHQIDESYTYPSCTSDDLNYYRLNDMYYETFDSKQACNAMKDSIDRGDEETIFKYKDEKVYEKAVKGMEEGGLLSEAAKYLCKKYGLNRVNYYYQNDDKMHKITVFWKYDE